MMFTSMTTAIAFSISAASPILAIQTFGTPPSLTYTTNNACSSTQFVY